MDESDDSEKHSSLMQRGVNYARKNLLPKFVRKTFEATLVLKCRC